MTQVGWIHLTITKCFTHTTLREGETNVLNPVVRPMTQVVGFTSLLPSVSHTHNFERGGNQCPKSGSKTNDSGWLNSPHYYQVLYTHNFERGGNQCLKSSSKTNDSGWLDSPHYYQVFYTHNFERGGNQCPKSGSMTNDSG